MRDFGRFVLLCFKEAFRHSKSIVDICGASLGIILPFITWLHPAWLTTEKEKALNALCWQVPMCVLVMTALARLVISPYWIYRDQRKTSATEADTLRATVAGLEKRLASKFTIEYDQEDPQCSLPASSGNPLLNIAQNWAHFRVRVLLGGDETVTNVVAIVQAVRKDGINMPMTEAVRLRFHNAKHMGDTLGEMNPGSPEMLDILRDDNGKLSLAVGRVYNSVDYYCCDKPNHTYDIEVTISCSKGIPKTFTFECPWTGDFSTTKCRVKPPLSVPVRDFDYGSA